MLLPKIKKIPKNTNGRLAIPALAGLLVYNVHDIIQLSCVVFCWQLKEVYTLLNENYVEDDDNMFRFDYSPEFLHWLVTACVYSQGLSQ